MTCRLGTPPSKAEEWTAGVPYTIGWTVFILGFVVVDVILEFCIVIRLRIVLGRF